MVNLAIEEAFRAIRANAELPPLFKLQFSFLDLSGIFIVVNDHYVLSENTGAAAAAVVSEVRSPVQRSEWIIDQVMQLKDVTNAYSGNGTASTGL